MTKPRPPRARSADVHLALERLDDRTVPAPVANGLLAQYYDTVDLSGPAIVRHDAKVDFNWGLGSPNSRIANNTFSARWTGLIQPRCSETYTFETRSDDGIRLFVDGVA